MDSDDEELGQAFDEVLSQSNTAPSTQQPPQQRRRPVPSTATTAPNARPSPGNQSKTSSTVQQPTPQALPRRAGPSAILVSKRQRGNPILDNVKLVPWEYADIPADYVVGRTTCVLFLSLKYHRLHPEYIYTRIRLLAGKYELRVLLAVVDIADHEASLKELSKTSLVSNLTLILAWSAAEAGHYLELFKTCENTTGAAIRAQQPQSYKESLVEFVTVPRSINKSDAASLISTFASLRAAINAAPEKIANVPGWGETKVRQWCAAIEEDFRVEKTKRRTAVPTRTVTTVAKPPSSVTAATGAAAQSPVEEQEQGQSLETADAIETADDDTNHNAERSKNIMNDEEAQTVGGADVKQDFISDEDEDDGDDDLLIAIRNAHVKRDSTADRNANEEGNLETVSADANADAVAD